MSNAQKFVTSFMTKLAGEATLTPLKDVFAKILAKQVVVAADGTVSFKASFANLSEIFTFIATPAADRPTTPLAYTDADVDAAKTAAATENDLKLGGDAPVDPELPTDEPTEEPTDGPTDEPTEEPGVEGETFTLTAGTDNFTLTDANDTVTGSVGTLNAADTIIDESTTDSDVLNVDLNAAGVAATIKNIEAVNVNWTSNAALNMTATNMTGNTFNMTADGLAFAGASIITDAGSNNFNYGDTLTGTLTLTDVVKSNIDAGQAGTVVVDGGTVTTVGQKTTATITTNKSTVTVTNTNTDEIQELTLASSVNATITLNSGAAASGIDEKLTVIGANDVVVTGLVTGEKIFNEKSSGSLVVKSTDTGAIDLSSIQADKIQISAAGTAVTAADGQKLEVTADATAGLTSLVAKTGVVNGTINLATNQTIAALDMATVGANHFTTLNLEVLKDATVALTTDAMQTTNVSGSGKLTLNATGVSAVDASAATGDFTYTQLGDAVTGVIGSATAKNTISFANNSSANATFIGGAAVDTVTLAAASGTVKVTTAAGDDKVIVNGALTGTTTIDMGAGTGDLLDITNVNGLATAAGVSKVTLSGVEEIKAVTGTVFNNDLLSGQTYKMTGGTAGNDNLVVFAYDKTGVATTATTDLSSLVFNDTVGSNFSTVTITGLDGVADTIKGTKLNDTIDGGTGKDTINISQGGVDTILIDDTSGDSTWSADSDKMTSITGFKAAANTADDGGDLITFTTAAVNFTDVTDLDVKGAVKSGTGSESVLATTTNGVITLSGTNANLIDTLEEWQDVAELVLAGAVVAGEVVGFGFGGNFYVVSEGAVGGAADDAIVELVGLTGVTSVNTTDGANVVHIA